MNSEVKVRQNDFPPKFGKLELVFFQDSKVWKVRVRFFFKAAKIGKVRVSIYFENCKVWKVRVKTIRSKSKLTPKVRLTYFYLWILRVGPT